MDAARKNVRSSNFELLRIVSMILIVAHHYAIHSGFSFDTASMSPHRFFVQFLSSGGKIGVNLFVLISGYFLLDSTFRIKKAVRLFAEVLFYSAGITAFCFVTGLAPFSFKLLIQSFLPLSFSIYWFASVYFALYLLSAFLAPALRGLSRKRLSSLWLLLFVIWCVLPTFTGQGVAFSELGWFLFLFVTAVYLKRFPIPLLEKRKQCFWLFLFFYVLMLLSVLTFELLGMKYAVFAENEDFFLAMHRLPAYAASVFLFLTFAKLKIKTCKWINALASCTFGVYLIHDHPLLSKILWCNLLQSARLQENRLLVLHALGSILLVFLIGTAMDLVRRRLIERLLFMLYDRLAQRIHNRLKAQKVK